jgi:hypothetical protein
VPKNVVLSLSEVKFGPITLKKTITLIISIKQMIKFPVVLFRDNLESFVTLVAIIPPKKNTHAVLASFNKIG